MYIDEHVMEWRMPWRKKLYVFGFVLRRVTNGSLNLLCGATNAQSTKDYTDFSAALPRHGIKFRKPCDLITREPKD